MTLKDCRQQFLAIGYSSSEYEETVTTFGGHAKVFLTMDSIIVQEPGYTRFVQYSFKEPPQDRSPGQTPPPPNAEFLFYLFLDAQNCDALVGDLEERYRLIHKKFGNRRADFWYWTQTIRSVGPIVWAWMKKAVMKPVFALLVLAAAKGLLKEGSWLAAVVELYRKVRS